LLRLVFSVIGIILVSGLPTLIRDGLAGNLSIGKYFQSIGLTLKDLWPLQEFTVLNYSTGKDVLVFPKIFDYIEYSLQILFLALLAAVFLALAFTVMTMLLPDSARERVKMMLYFLESLPDLLIIMLAQIGVIFIFEK